MKTPALRTPQNAVSLLFRSARPQSNSLQVKGVISKPVTKLKTGPLIKAKRSRRVAPAVARRSSYLNSSCKAIVSATETEAAPAENVPLSQQTLEFDRVELSDSDDDAPSCSNAEDDDDEDYRSDRLPSVGDMLVAEVQKRAFALRSVEVALGAAAEGSVKHAGLLQQHTRLRGTFAGFLREHGLRLDVVPGSDSAAGQSVGQSAERPSSSSGPTDEGFGRQRDSTADAGGRKNSGGKDAAALSWQPVLQALGMRAVVRGGRNAAGGGIVVGGGPAAATGGTESNQR